MANGKHVVLDWDGTMVRNAWPDEPRELLPGAVETLLGLREQGVTFEVFSARTNPYAFREWTERNPMDVQRDIEYIRSVLNANSLNFVDIYTKAGKPPGDVYVDDKGLWYPGRPGSWAALGPKIEARLGLKGGDDDND